MFSDVRQAAWRALGALSGPWMAVDRRAPALRVLGYHDVSDVERLRSQLGYLVERFTPIGLDEVIPFLEGERVVARRPVWVTFDDGDPSVVELGLPVLEEFEIRATMFVCPGVLDTTTPFWWQVARAGIEANVVLDQFPLTPDAISTLKEEPDATRRRDVERISELVEDATGRAPTHHQISSAQIARWLDGGHTLGNHTWDHPLLDNCSSRDQHEQVVSAHERLAEILGRPPTAFAYTNGNTTPESAELLSDLGYEVGLLFDHRIARPGDPLGMSRLRVNTSDDITSFKARVSGLHPWIHRLRRGT